MASTGSSGFLGSRAIPGGVTASGNRPEDTRVVSEQKGKEVISKVP